VLERLGRLVQLDLRLADRLALLGDEAGRELVDVRVERLRPGAQDRAVRSPTAARRIAPRSVSERRDHSANAAWAAFTARSTVSGDALVARPTSAPVAGFAIVRVSPSTDSIDPPTKAPRSSAVAAALLMRR